MVEIGTTNRTWLKDYEAAAGPDTGLVLKVHPSNYRVMGFTQEVQTPDLGGVATAHGVPLVFDVGSGLLDENVPWLTGAPPAWLRGEPGVRQALEDGADLVTFSGDKLLGGPQAGIIVGTAELVGRLRKSPIARALRIDGATMAALTVTFEAYASGTAATLPFWEMATRDIGRLTDRLAAIAHGAGIASDIVESQALPGAGSVPGMVIPSPALRVRARPADELFFGLLTAGIVTRRDAGVMLIDVRAVQEEADGAIAEALGAICRS
jgi:L-seryl-tRNA(Ser) seleniumtransferase